MAILPRYFAGLDWSSEKHDLCILDGEGQIVLRGIIAHTAEGLRDLVQQLRRFPAVRIAIERPTRLLVDTLLEASLVVVPIHPNKLKATRPRYTAAPAISDASDAYILADLLRTDGHRFAPLRAPSDRSKALRALVRTRDDLIATRVQLCNQLRELLLSFWPAPVGLFHKLESRISLAFLERYPTPQSTARLGEKRLAGFLTNQSYCGRQSPAQLLAKLRAAPSSAAGAQERRVGGELVQSLVRVLRSLKQELERLESEIRAALAVHPDRNWHLSFPGIGVTTAAQILAEIGEEPARFAGSAHLAAEGGVVPVTQGSGKKKSVCFRFACNKRLRRALTCWAANSRKESLWAQEKYHSAKSRGCSHAHAGRIVACAWLGVFWRCWNDRVPYDTAKHGGAQRLEPLRKAA